jgi:hypothetical protein
VSAEAHLLPLRAPTNPDRYPSQAEVRAKLDGFQDAPGSSADKRCQSKQMASPGWRRAGGDGGGGQQHSRVAMPGRPAGCKTSSTLSLSLSAAGTRKWNWVEFTLAATKYWPAGMKMLLSPANGGGRPIQRQETSRVGGGGLCRCRRRHSRCSRSLASGRRPNLFGHPAAGPQTIRKLCPGERIGNFYFARWPCAVCSARTEWTTRHELTNTPAGLTRLCLARSVASYADERRRRRLGRVFSSDRVRLLAGWLV